jgi:hypothetical protein
MNTPSVHAENAVPLLFESQVSCRLDLARKRTAQYPLDSMDFILMDLERPPTSRRFADFCTGDLTGRLLWFLSSTDGIDGQSDPRLRELFERILKQRQSNGLFGKPAAQLDVTQPFTDKCGGVGYSSNMLLFGFVAYYAQTGDLRSLQAACGMVEFILTRKHLYREWLGARKGKPCIEMWITHPLARLYRITGDRRYLDLCATIRDSFDRIEGTHSHGLGTTLRGLQLAALYSGDMSWNERVEQFRKRIALEFATADGGVSESYPESARNEGCSIADWMVVNLQAGLLMGDDTAYEMAEHIFYNAFAFNQLDNGIFGLRQLTRNGYGIGPFEQAWCCCLHHCGTAIGEYARHAVCLRNGAVHVNLLVPGRYTVQGITVTIRSNYPSGVHSIVTVTGQTPDTEVRVRVPSCVRNATKTERRQNDEITIVLNGEIGHTVEESRKGRVLKYGPLVLAPQSYFWSPLHRSMDDAVPCGWGGPIMPAGFPKMLLDGLADSNGFLKLKKNPERLWNHYDAGPTARFHVRDAEVGVPVRFDSGEEMELVFTPLCSATSYLVFCETPIVFKDSKGTT